MSPSTIKTFIADKDWSKHREEYRERLRKFEPVWLQGGAVTQATQRVGRMPYAGRKKGFPFSQEDILSPTRYLASPDTWPSQNVTESNILSHPTILKSAQCTRIEVKFMFYLA